MEKLKSQTLPVANQPPPEKQIKFDFVIGALETVYAKIFAILTFIYLIVQFLAILGILPKPYGILPEPYRPPTILVSIGLIVIFTYYYIYIKAYKFTIKILNDNINLLTEENKKLKEELEEFKQKTIPKDPSKLISEHQHIGYPDVRFAIYSLSKKIEDSGFFGGKQHGRYNTKENIIFGIDRGGAILGGLLAKNLGVAIKTFAINWADKQPQIITPDPSYRGETSIIYGKCLDNIDYKKVKNILLVDDTIRGGDTMLAAKTLLRNILTDNKIPFIFICDENRTPQPDEIKINIACILYQQEDIHRIKLPEFCVYQTKAVKRYLLWDTTRDEMKIPDKEKEIFDKYYENIPNKQIQ